MKSNITNSGWPAVRSNNALAMKHWPWAAIMINTMRIISAISQARKIMLYYNIAKAE